jgi:hypothetical protein
MGETRFRFRIHCRIEKQRDRGEREEDRKGIEDDERKITINLGAYLGR